MKDESVDTLHRGLSNRHIQLIALGSAIGTGLFMGSSRALQVAGPGILLAYALGGFIAFLIMRQLAEMAVEEPVAGSFSTFAYKYLGDFAGFITGWNYWILYVLVSMVELTAAAGYMHYWFSHMQPWIWALVFFLLINFVNLWTVRFYGEAEFWFSIIKVIAVIAMILFGGYLLVSGNAGPKASVSNLWDDGGFLPFGASGMFLSLGIIMFSFGGLELIGITAAEAKDPRKTIPKATNQIVYRILLFYIGALAILLSLYPWRQINPETSAFVMIFHDLDETLVSHVLNLVVLTAALSVYNSGVYCNSRMLFGLATQGNAPRVLAHADRRGVPIPAIVASGVVTALVVVVNYNMPREAFGLLMSLATSAAVINWIMISVTHMAFRSRKNREGVDPQFKVFWYPWTNLLCILFMLAVLTILYIFPNYPDIASLIQHSRLSVQLIPVWLALLLAGYGVKYMLSRRRTVASIPVAGSGQENE